MIADLLIQNRLAHIDERHDVVAAAPPPKIGHAYCVEGARETAGRALIALSRETRGWRTRQSVTKDVPAHWGIGAPIGFHHRSRMDTSGPVLFL